MWQKRRGNWLKHMDFFILDILCMEIAYVFAFIYRHGWRSPFDYPIYEQLNVLMLIIHVVYVIFRHNYKDILRRDFLHEGLEVLVHNSTIWMALLVYIYVTKQAYWFSRTVFLLAWGSGCVLMFVVHLLWKRVIRSRMRKGAYQPKMLILAADEMAKSCIRKIKERRYNGYQLIGLVIWDKDVAEGEVEGLPVICTRENLYEYVRTQIVDDVFIMAKYDDELFAMCKELARMGIKVHISVENMPEELPNKYIETVAGYTVVTSSIHTITAGQQFVKRCIDIAAGIVGTIITGVAFIFVAPLIYRESPGPIFFQQERIGKNGRRFKMYKFRSMYMDAEERKKELMKQNKMQGLMFKIDNDPRIIGSSKGPGKGIGNFIRKTSIDELPQFLNVLKGDMSLIGTRPPTVDEYEQYERHHKVRLSIKPGITGLWQVSGRSDITDFEEIVKLDEKYIENWSLKQDVKIILKTVEVVLKGRGAE